MLREKEIDETTFLENWPRSSALVNVFDRMALDQNDMHFIFNLMDLNGDGTIDESELAQVYLQLKQISDDPTWIALVRGSRSREHRRYHLQRATEVYGYVKFIKDIQADLEESLPAAHAIAQEAAQESRQIIELYRLKHQMHTDMMRQIGAMTGSGLQYSIIAAQQKLGFQYQGDVVMSVTPGGLADINGCRMGDIMLLLNKKPVKPMTSAEKFNIVMNERPLSICFLRPNAYAVSRKKVRTDILKVIMKKLGGSLDKRIRAQMKGEEPMAGSFAYAVNKRVIEDIRKKLTGRRTGGPDDVLDR